LKGKGKGYSKDDYKAADGFFRAIRQRKGMVDHAENKIVAAKAFAEIVSKYNGRMLVFGGDNSFTDSISNAIEGSVVYHSKKTTKQKDLALDRFKNGESNVLCSTKALNQGLDIPDASIGLICGLTSKALTMIQRVGRLVRIDPNDPLKQGRVVILYVKDSQEEKWLENALSKTDKKNVKWLELKDILKAKSKESLPPLIQKI
jgi:superfamily II DNA or RNA helicase